MLPGQDCYFYYYSSCSRGDGCPFRHEPAALTNETVCTYWKAGNCNKPHCIFRHLEVGSKKRNVTPCYWETQPQGCSKPHCPFLHQQPKDPVKQPLPGRTASLSPVPPSVPPTGLDTGSIIVNPARLESLGSLLPSGAGEVAGSGERRVSLPTAAALAARQAVTGGIKARLGGSNNVRDRLGRADRQLLGLDPESEDYQEYNSEEEKLRRSAMRTLDLRARLDTRLHSAAQDSDTDEELGRKRVKSSVNKLTRKEKILLREEKIRKLMKDQKKAKTDLKEERKKKKKEKARILSDTTDVYDNVQITRKVSLAGGFALPSASDYSDLDSPPASPPRAILPSLRSDQPSRPGARQRLGGAGDRERQNYAARVLGDLVQGGRGQGFRPSNEVNLSSNLKRRLGRRAGDSGDEEAGREEPRRKERRRSSSPVRKREKKEKKVKVKKEKKGKRAAATAVFTSDEEKPKRKKAWKKSEPEPEFAEGEDDETAKPRKLKSRRKKKDSVSTDVSALLALNSSQEDAAANVEDPASDVLKELDEFLND